MLSEVLKFAAGANLAIAKGITNELVGNPKAEDLKLTIRIEIKSLESYLDKNKSKYSHDQISKIKSKCNSFRNDAASTRDHKKLQGLLIKVKEFAKVSKK